MITNLLLAGWMITATQAADTSALRAQLGRAAGEYESSLRSAAPHRLGQSGFCSERVGRYCVIYDAGRGGELAAEARDVRVARARAIEAHKRAAALWPADSAIAARLIRYLVEDGQGGEAVAVAQEFVNAGADPAWAQLLLGYALHGANRDADADEAFARGLMLALPIERQQMHDVTLLLSNDEREHYGRLTGARRSAYHARLWNLADPLYLTPGNESLVEHLFRRVHGRILASTPGAEWEADDEALAIRFGVPEARTQQFTPNGRIITEHFHPEQLTYVPPSLLSKGGAARFEPGAAWPFDTIRAHSGYAPRSIRWMQVLAHQVSRYPVRDSVRMRANFQFALDEQVRAPARVEVALFALDSMYNVLAEQRDTVMAAAQLMVGAIELHAPARAAAYSLETREVATGQAGRARYALNPLPRGRLTVSDLVIVGADAKPLSTLEIARGQQIGLFLEVRGLRPGANRQVRYRVDLEVLEQERPGVFSRTVRGLARALGVARQDVLPRVTWSEQQNFAELAAISLQLGKIELDPGLKLFRLTITDAGAATPAIATVDRLIRIR